MSNPSDQIDAMLALCARATPGPWVDLGDTDGPYAGAVVAIVDSSIHDGGTVTPVSVDPEMDDRPEDRAFIAASRTGWEATLRVLKHVVEELQEMSTREQGDPGEPATRLLAMVTKELAMGE